MVGWTEIGQKIQPLSKPRLIPVQGMSKKRSLRGSVQSLSKSRQSYVKAGSSSETPGQRLDMQIQRLSKLCPIKLKILHFSSLDSFLTYFGLENKVLRVNVLSFWKYWNWTEIGQSFDTDGLWTKSKAVDDGPWAFGSINPDFVQILSMSNDCPISDQFQFFLLSKCQNMNPENFVFNSKVCQETVQRGKMQYCQIDCTEFL